MNTKNITSGYMALH